MGRFSRAEAEAAGWTIFHERDAFDVDAPGGTRTTPASIRAERYVSLPGQASTLVTEEAETMGLLLERISAYEAHLRGLPSQRAAEVDETTEPRFLEVDERGGATLTEDIAGTVLLPNPDDPEGDPIRVSDAAYTGAARTDALLVPGDEGEEFVMYGGAREDFAPAVDAIELVRKDAEDKRTAEPFVGDTKQITTEAAGAGQIIVRADEDSLEEASDRQIAENKDLEDVRVNLAPVDHVVVAPEGKDIVAGTDVGIAARTDLESEQPGAGQVAGSTPLDSRETPVTPATAEAVEEANDAGEEAALKARSEADNAEEEDGADAQRDVEQARADSEANTQENAREADPGESGKLEGTDQEPQSEGAPAVDSGADQTDAPNASPAAEKLAAEKGVNLSDVQGTGSNGKVTKPDVEKHLSEKDG